MKRGIRFSFIAAVVTGTLFAEGAAAQQQVPAEPRMGGTSQMPDMMMAQRDTARLMDQLVASFAAIQAETDPEALKQELAEHGRLLKELQTKIQTEAHRMEMMRRAMAAGVSK